MSTPNDPDKDYTAGGTGDKSNGSGSGSGTPTGGLVPPWQRGQMESSTSPSRTEQGREDVGRESGSRPGPPPRGVVTTGTAAASMSGQQAPVTKLDNNSSRGSSGQGNSSGQGSGGFVESPTSTIERDSMDTTQMPDLDEIHNPEAKRGPSAEPVRPARSAPTHVRGKALRAAIQIRRIEPWATFKISAVLAVVGFFIWMIAVAVLYLVLDGMGVWDQVNNSYGSLVTADGSTSEGDIIGAGTVFGAAALLGAINAILITALATIGSYIYNICADMVGGAEVTLADLD